MAKQFENWNSDFIKQFSTQYTYLYEDNSERLGKFKVYQSLKKNSEFSLVALKEVEIHQVEEKLKEEGHLMHRAIEEYIDDFMKAIKKVLENKMNLHQSILQMIAYECQVLEIGSIQRLQHIKLYYEYFPNNILQEAKRKYCFNNIGFQETEIWQILFNISSLMYHLEGQNRWVGNLIPENIYYAHTNGEVKILPYKMSLLDDIQQTFTFIKQNINSPMNRDINQFQTNTLCNLDITKYFKSNILSLGISLLRIMICNELFSFEVQEQLKKKCIEQATLQELIRRCQLKYNGFIIKILIAMTEENEHKRPTGTQLFRFLSNYSQQIKQGYFNGSQIQEQTIFEDLSNSYDFKKSPSLYASQKYSSIIRKNSMSLDEKSQEDENNKMQKILDSVKKIISKKTANDNNYTSDKSQKQDIQNDSRSKAQNQSNQTYESFTEMTDKQSISEFQQIQTDNQIQSNISLIPTFTNVSKLTEIQKSNQNQAKIQVDIPLPNQKRQSKKQSINEKQLITNNNPNQEKETSFQNTYLQNNSFISNMNLPSQNNFNNFNYQTPQKVSDNSQIFISQIANTKNKQFQVQVDKSIQTDDNNQIFQNLSQMHQKQLETIKLAYQELQKLTKDINSLSEQRTSLLEQNKRLMEINDKLILQNKEQALSQLSYNKKLKDISKNIQESSKFNGIVAAQDRQNHFQQIDPRFLKQTSFSQPPLLSYDKPQNSQCLSPNLSLSTQQANYISKTPLLAIHRRDLDLSQSRSNEIVQTPSNRDGRVKSLDNYSCQAQNISLSQNYSVKPFVNQSNQFEKDFIVQDELMRSNTFQSSVLSPQQNKISQIKSPKTYKILDLSRKNSILIPGEESYSLSVNQSQNVTNNQHQQQQQQVSKVHEISKQENQQQKSIDASLVQSQNFYRQSLRQTFQDLTNQNLIRSELKEGKCINIYQIRSPSNPSRECSPQLSYSPQSPNLALMKIPITNQNQNQNQELTNVNTQTKCSEFTQNSYLNNNGQNNYLQQSDLSINQNKHHLSSAVKKNSETDCTQSNLIYRQSRISTSVSNFICFNGNKNQEYSDKQINANGFTNNQIVLTETRQQQQQVPKTIYNQLDEKIQLKKSASLPKPFPTLHNSSYTTDSRLNTIPFRANEDSQNQAQKMNKNLNPSQLINNFTLSQQGMYILKEQHSQPQYSQIHKRQVSLTEPQKQSQISVQAQQSKLPLENKNESQNLKLKTISGINSKLQNQEIDNKTGQKWQIQSYNITNSPHQQQYKQNPLKNGLFLGSQQQNLQKSEKSNLSLQNSSILLPQKAQKPLIQNTQQQTIEKQSTVYENKTSAIRSPKSRVAQPPFLILGTTKKTDQKTNEGPLKTFQNNSKSQLFPK